MLESMAKKLQELTGDDLLFQHLTDIHDFQLVLQISVIPELADDRISAEIARALYHLTSDLLAAAELYFDNELGIRSRSGQCGVIYDDDRFQFEVLLETERLAIRRTGSSLAWFHRWYATVMYHVPTLVEQILNALETKLGRKVKIVNGGFEWRFVLYDLKMNGPVQNWKIMKKLLPAFPGDAGMLDQNEQVYRTTARADYNVARWIQVAVPNDEPVRRILRYTVQAPANKSWSTLWFRLSYAAENYTDPASEEREAVDGLEFLKEFESCYESYLYPVMLKGFLKSVIGDYTFKSSAGVLP